MPVPRQVEIWRAILDHRLLDVHTALPGKVTAFDAANQTCTVQPLIKNVVRDVDENSLEESYPEIREVPIAYPRAGGFILAWPLSVGDPVTLLFNEWSIDAYLEKGQETHPVDLERHGFSGAIALPIGPYKASNTIGETIDALMIGYDGGAVIRIDSSYGRVRIGSTGGTVQAAALADDAKAEIVALRNTVNSLVSAYNLHSHASLGAAPTGPGTPASAPASVNSFGSSKVTVEE